MKPQILSQIDSRLMRALSGRILKATNYKDAIDDFDKLSALSERTPFDGNLEKAALYINSFPEITTQQSQYLEEKIQSIKLDQNARRVKERALANTEKGYPSGIHTINTKYTIAIDTAKFLQSRFIENADSWPVPVAFHDDNWRPMLEDDLIAAVETILSIESESLQSNYGQLLKETISGRELELTFYEGAKVVELLIHPDGGVQRTMVVMFTPRTLVFFDGSSPMIHEFNAHNKLKLKTKKQAIQYLKFFCAFVHGEEGAFNVVSELDTARDRLLDQEEFPAIADSYTPSEVNKEEKNDENKLWRINTHVLYSNAFFKAIFSIHKTGMVEMLDDEPIIADLPIKRDKYTLGWRVVLEE